MSGLAGHVEDYLRLRRALGFKLRFHGQVLPSLAAYLEAAGATTVTAELAVAWAGLPQGVHPVVWSHRLGAARGFARYLKTADPAAEIPPDRVWTTVAPRRQPVIFTDGDIARLLQAARALNPPLRAATFEAMLGLIAATGMRLGEATGLDRAGTDLEAGLLTIVSTKSGRDRLVPLHPTVTAALAGYARRRDELCPAPSTTRFFVSSVGTPVHERLADLAFAQLTGRLGLREAALRDAQDKLDAEIRGRHKLEADLGDDAGRRASRFLPLAVREAADLRQRAAGMPDGPVKTRQLRRARHLDDLVALLGQLYDLDAPGSPVAELAASGDSQRTQRASTQVRSRGLVVPPVGGANHIGGSSLLIEAGGTRVLVDAGLKPQAHISRPGPERIEEAVQSRVDAVVVTHAHADHAGFELFSFRPGQMSGTCLTSTTMFNQPLRLRMRSCH